MLCWRLLPPPDSVGLPWASQLVVAVRPGLLVQTVCLVMFFRCYSFRFSFLISLDWQDLQPEIGWSADRIRAPQLSASSPRNL